MADAVIIEKSDSYAFKDLVNNSVSYRPIDSSLTTGYARADTKTRQVYVHHYDGIVENEQ